MKLFFFSVIYSILAALYVVAALFSWGITFEEFFSSIAFIIFLYIVILFIVKKKKKLDEERRRKQICARTAYFADDNITDKRIAGTCDLRNEKLKMYPRNSKRRKKFMRICLSIILLAVLSAGVVKYYHQSRYIPESLIEFAEKYPEAADREILLILDILSF
ncbi:MAG: hypothetical protein LUI07_02525 [Lachnospiraceae bacterium]|nr:hypothetical protein [Lachnospiraceae bacterium]